MSGKIEDNYENVLMYKKALSQAIDKINSGNVFSYKCVAWAATSFAFDMFHKYRLAGRRYWGENQPSYIKFFKDVTEFDPCINIPDDYLEKPNKKETENVETSNTLV
jgi:hypothetical protein